jgi:hypothetical protein
MSDRVNSARELYLAFAFVRLVESGDEVIVTHDMNRQDGGRGRNTSNTRHRAPAPRGLLA